MARKYTRLKLSVWDDTDFITLSDGAQRCYWMLCSQKTLSFAGVIPLQAKKWARLAANTATEDIEAHLAELVDARFLLVDDHSEEVLVRTFIKHDGGATNPNLSKAISTAIAKIESARLREIAQAEFDKARNPQVTDPDEGPSEDPEQGAYEGLPEGLPEATCIPNPVSLNPESSNPLILNPSSSSDVTPLGLAEIDDDDDPLTLMALGLLATKWTKQNATKGKERGYRIAIIRNAEDHLPLLRDLVNERPRATAESVAAAYEAAGWAAVVKAEERIPHPASCVCDGTGMVPVEVDAADHSSYVRPCTAPQNLATIHQLRPA
jgi:hypothetical protein